MKLILASTSKFKSKILNTTGLKHTNIESNFKEESKNYNDVYKYVEDLSFGKAKSVEDKINDGIILSLDTVVYVDGIILEKPKTLEEAKNNLRLCSGNTSYVITGITLINKYNDEIITDCVSTKIILRKISESDIDYYIENEPSILRVSGFVFETMVSNFLDKIEGSYYNILGIPTETIYKHLNSWGITLKDLEN